MKTAQIYVGDLPWGNGSAFVITSSFVTATTTGSGTNVQWIAMTHPDPGYSYQVFVQMYANRSSSQDNDPYVEKCWTYPVSATSTRINVEYNSAESTT